MFYEGLEWHDIKSNRNQRVRIPVLILLCSVTLAHMSNLKGLKVLTCKTGQWS